MTHWTWLLVVGAPLIGGFAFAAWIGLRAALEWWRGS